MSADDRLERPKSVQAAFEVYQGKPDTGPHATALFAYIEALEAERDEAKRRLAEEFANMDATMRGWDRLCEQSEADASALEASEAKIAALTAAKDAAEARVEMLLGDVATLRKESDALTAENATLREALAAVDQHDRSNFVHDVGGASQRASWRGAIRKVRAALRQEGKP